MSMTELSFDAIDAMLLPDRPLMEDVVDLHHKVMVFDEIDSTNDEAKRLLEEENVDDGTYLIANHQTAGRGRQGHSFYSPADTGLYVSMIRTDHDVLHPVTLSKLTLAAAVATAEAIEEAVGVSPQIKWVNDLYYRDRKVCGILTESVGWLDDRPRAVAVLDRTPRRPAAPERVSEPLLPHREGDHVRAGPHPVPWHRPGHRRRGTPAGRADQRHHPRVPGPAPGPRFRGSHISRILSFTVRKPGGDFFCFSSAFST